MRQRMVLRSRCRHSGETESSWLRQKNWWKTTAGFVCLCPEFSAVLQASGVRRAPRTPELPQSLTPQKRRGIYQEKKKKWQRGLKTVEERGEIFELILQKACPDPPGLMLCLTRKVLADLSWFCTTTAQAFAFLATQPSCQRVTRTKKTKHHPGEVSMSSFWCSFKAAVSALHKDLGSCFLYHFQNLK